jgi:hypothetical protein
MPILCRLTDAFVYGDNGSLAMSDGRDPYFKPSAACNPPLSRV